jgi:hypothetical protein
MIIRINISKEVNMPLNIGEINTLKVKRETDIMGLFKSGGTTLTKKDKIEGLDDFELICFLVVR